jgi:hypothetical protein
MVFNKVGWRGQRVGAQVDKIRTGPNPVTVNPDVG